MRRAGMRPGDGVSRSGRRAYYGNGRVVMGAVAIGIEHNDGSAVWAVVRGEFDMPYLVKYRIAEPWPHRCSRRTGR